VSTTRAYGFRDAGLHSKLLRTLNLAGAGLRGLGIERPTLAPDAIVAAARRRSGLHDLGEDSVREPLEVLCDAVERESRLTTFGRIALRGLLVEALCNRMLLLDWAARHPEVREEKIECPWIVVGLPRTGTTLLSILLGLDPLVRPLEQWEASKPVPPPELATWREDPRIAECAATFEQLQALNPPIRAMHPFGATLATECVTLLIFDLRALSIETQAFVPSYGRWLEQADMGSAYRMHRLALQVLQSRLPTATWSLKTPNHLWCLPTLLEQYPDARIIWTHRDPRKVVPSVASLNCALQRAFSNHTDPLAIGQDWSHKLHLAVTRGLAFDAEHGSDWCCHVQYAELLADPVASVEKIYQHFGETPGPLHSRRMRAFLRDRPRDLHGRHRYEARDFGFDDAQLGARFADYCERFDVPRED
jgi:hypothetical protein